jgi:tetratricopeptide (TPR) repeat protein
MRPNSRFSAAALCLLLTMSAAPLAAQDVPPTQEAPAVPAAPVVEAPAAPAASTFAAAEGVIVGRDAGGQVVWRHALVSPGDAALVHGPVKVADVVFYCVHSQLWEAEAASGQVRRRHMLVGSCEGLAASADKVTVSLKGWDGGWEWLQDEVFSPGQVVRLRFADELKGALLLRRQSSRLVESIIPTYNMESTYGERVALLRGAADKLPALVAALEAAAAQDPTNPWLLWRLSEARAAQEDEAGAADARARLLKIDPAYHHDLVRISTDAEKVDPALADRLFGLGMKHALEQGYEPELVKDARFVYLFGLPGAQGFDPATPEGLKALDRLGERLVDYAPHVEMIAVFYKGLADAHRAKGDEARAAVWAERAADPRTQTRFGSGPSKAQRAGGLQMALLAMLIVFGIAGLLKTGRTLGATFPQSVSPVVRWNPLSRWGRPELVGIVCLLLLAHLLALRVAEGISMIGISAWTPPTFACGMPGSPSALKFVEGADSTPGGALVVGIHQHRAGLAKEAEASYLKSGTDEAKNNLGVLKAEQGDTAGARALWEQVSATVPEAAYNLGREARGPRVERAKRYQLMRPLLALPTQAHWDGFWEAKLEASGRDRSNLITSLSHVSTMSSIALESRADLQWSSYDVRWYLLLGWLLAILAVVALATAWDAPQPQYKRWHLGAWVVGHFFPGMARQWGPVGPLVTTLLITAMMARASMQGGALPSLLDNMATPSYSKLYGIGGHVITPNHLAPLATLGQSWWMLWIAGVVLSIGLEFAMPDPVRRREE